MIGMQPGDFNSCADSLQLLNLVVDSWFGLELSTSTYSYGVVGMLDSEIHAGTDSTQYIGVDGSYFLWIMHV